MEGGSLWGKDDECGLGKFWCLLLDLLRLNQSIS